MTLNRTRRLFLYSLLAAIAPGSSPAAAQTTATPLFPPIGELLGETRPDLLPRPRSGLRDALRGKPSFRSDLRALRHRNKDVRKSAIRRLGARGQVRAIPYLGAVVLKSNEDAGVRAAAAMALGHIGDWKTLTFLKRSVLDESREVRFASALALGKVRSLEAIRLLDEAALRDPHWWVRYAAAVALGEGRGAAAVPPLARALQEDLRWQVRQQAARSLGQIGGLAAARALGRGLRDEDATIRSVAARALGEIGGSASLNFLHAAYGKEKEELPRMMIASSLRKITTR